MILQIYIVKNYTTSYVRVRLARGYRHLFTWAKAGPEEAKIRQQAEGGESAGTGQKDTLCLGIEPSAGASSVDS